MAERFNPEGKVALITGGAGGIGFALARRFGAAGCRVALLDVDEVGLAELLGRARRGGGGASWSAVATSLTAPTSARP